MVFLNNSKKITTMFKQTNTQRCDFSCLKEAQSNRNRKDPSLVELNLSYMC